MGHLRIHRLPTVSLRVKTEFLIIVYQFTNRRPTVRYKLGGQTIFSTIWMLLQKNMQNNILFCNNYICVLQNYEILAEFKNIINYFSYMRVCSLVVVFSKISVSICQYSTLLGEHFLPDVISYLCRCLGIEIATVCYIFRLHQNLL